MTLDEIAKRAKVSRATVSLALNGKPGVSQKTRNQILSIARELGYVKKNAPRSTARENKIIRLATLPNRGFVSHTFSDQPFFSSLLGHIEAACRDRGYGLMYSTLGNHGLIESLLEQEHLHPSEGIIILGTNLSKNEANQVRSHLYLSRKVVFLDVKYDDVPGNFIVMNNKLGACQAAEHLFQLGHRNIGYVRSNIRIQNFIEREEGFFSAAQALGISGNCKVYETSPSLLSPQEDFLNQFLSTTDRPTALFCECDYIAISVIRALLRAGLSVPDDVSVVGFDDIPEAELCSPPLTTIQVPRQLMGELSVATITDRRLEPHASINQKTLLDTELISRESSRKLK